MKQLLTLASITLLALAATHSHAAGTQAGATIANEATVTYNAGAGTISATSQTVNVIVQELINVTVVSQDANKVNISSPQDNAYLKFQITNTGNGSEAFVISQSNLSGSDDFDVTYSNVYLDDGDGTFEPEGDDVPYDTSSIAADASIVIWVASSIPTGLSDGQEAEVQVKALAKTFSDAGQTNPSAGDVVAGGDGGTSAVYGTAAASADDNATFIVSAITVTINKEVSAVRDNLGGSGTQPVPGADVDYTLTVTVTGTGTANEVVVSDPLPATLALKDGTDGTITVNAVAMTAASDTDGANYDANTNTISVNLGNISAGTSARTIQFTTSIQ
ncbi:MAG: hypothetical protein RPR40_11145 [Bermanella sp.]